jgi:hypothetical protein
MSRPRADACHQVLTKSNKRPRRKQRGIATLFLTFHAPQGAGNLPVILLKCLLLNPIDAIQHFLKNSFYEKRDISTVIADCDDC